MMASTFALIGTMVYSIARVSAVVDMKARDYYPQGKRISICQESGCLRPKTSNDVCGFD